MRAPVFAIVLALLTPAANSQPPAEVPLAVKEAVDEIADKSGLAPFGKTMIRELEDGEVETIELAVSPGDETLVVLRGDEDVLALAATASAAGAEIASIRNSAGPVLRIPAGNGGEITLEVEMVCDYVVCRYFIQPFVRAPAS